MSLLDKASLIVTPNSYKESKLYSVVPSSGAGDMDVVRATTATRVNSAGLIEVVPRNLVTYSNTFSNAAWTKGSTITLTGGQTGYDATNNAWLLSKGAIQYPAIGQSVSNSGTKTLSVYAKANTNTKICLFASASPSNFYQDFDLSNGTLGSNSFGVVSTLIENVGNGWYRCSVVFNGTTTDFNIFPDDILGDNAGSVFIQNAQIESGSLTEYFPTTTRLNIPRIDYTNGSCPSLLVEPQRTNLFTYSNDYSTTRLWFPSVAGGSTSQYTLNYGISPDGTQNAGRIQLALNGGPYADWVNVFNVLTIGQTYTYSIYLKSLTSNCSLYFLGDGAANILKNVTTQWVRYTHTFTATTAFYVPRFLIEAGTSTTADILAWGGQIEQGSYATSLIPTQGSSVTRNADVISKTGISSLIGQTEGTLFVDTYVGDLSSEVYGWIQQSFSGNPFDSLQINRSNTNVQCQIYVGSNLVGFISGGSITKGQRIKVAVGYKLNDVVLYLNGVQIGVDVSSTIPTCSVIALGTYVPLPNDFVNNGGINTTALFKTRLTNTELAQLTTL
jgi:hypothetical protein